MSVRKNGNKPRMAKALLMPKAIAAIADVIHRGEEKYGSANQRGWLDYEADEVADSLIRHLTSWMGEDLIDEESGLPHSFHVLANAAIIVELTSCYSSEDSSPQTRPEDSNLNSRHL